jgi:hypothetical protein
MMTMERAVTLKREIGNVVRQLDLGMVDHGGSELSMVRL